MKSSAGGDVRQEVAEVWGRDMDPHPSGGTANSNPIVLGGYMSYVTVARIIIGEVVTESGESLAQGSPSAGIKVPSPSSLTPLARAAEVGCPA